MCKIGRPRNRAVASKKAAFLQAGLETSCITALINRIIPVLKEIHHDEYTPFGRMHCCVTKYQQLLSVRRHTSQNTFEKHQVKRADIGQGSPGIVNHKMRVRL